MLFRSRGWLRGEVGRGTYVQRPDAGADALGLWNAGRPEGGPIDLVMNLPPPGEGGAELRRTLAALVDEPSLAGLLDHHSDGWIERHCRSAAAWLARTGLDARLDGLEHATWGYCRAMAGGKPPAQIEALTEALGTKYVGFDRTAIKYYCVGAEVLGVLLLFATVVAERYREWRVDPYRDVQR